MARRARSSSDRRSRSSSSRSRRSKSRSSRSSSKSSKSKKSRSRKSRKASSQSGSRRRRSRSRSRRSPSRSRRNRRARARGGRRRAERSRSRSRRNRSSKRRSKSPAPGAKSASASATSEAYGGAYSLYGWGSGYRSWSAWPAAESSYYSGYSAYNQGYQYTQRDYATEKPENYMAFVQQHVREGKNGTEVTLSNKMCQDQHVDDLLRCMESWLARQYGRSSAQPWQLGTLDLSLNGLSDDSVARIADRLRQLHVRVRCLDLTGNKAGTKGLVALEGYLWNCSEPFQEISLADNEIVVEAGCGEENPVSSFLRCLYNHPNYPRKTSSDAGVLIHPLVLRLGKNRIGDLPGLLRDIRTKVGGRARFCRSAEAYKESESEEFLSVHIADLPEDGEAEDPEPEAEDSAWKRRQRRRKAKELSSKDEKDAKERESPKSEESEEQKPKEAKKKKAKKENGKSKKKKKRSKRKVSQVTEENGKEQTQTQTGPGSDAETEEGEEENSDEVDAEAPEPVEPVEAEVPEPAEPAEPGSSKPSKPARTFSPSALSSEDQSRLKKETAERLRLMEGLVESIGESALGKLAELTVRLLVSGKRSEDMMSELKPFVGKQRASELVEWMDEHCQSGVSVSETAETADEKGFMLFTVCRTKHQFSLESGDGRWEMVSQTMLSLHWTRCDHIPMLRKDVENQ
eukprot:s1004_g20.t1